MAEAAEHPIFQRLSDEHHMPQQEVKPSFPDQPPEYSPLPLPVAPLLCAECHSPDAYYQSPPALNYHNPPTYGESCSPVLGPADGNANDQTSHILRGYQEVRQHSINVDNQEIARGDVRINVVGGGDIYHAASGAVVMKNRISGCCVVLAIISALFVILLLSAAVVRVKLVHSSSNSDVMDEFYQAGGFHGDSTVICAPCSGNDKQKESFSGAVPEEDTSKCCVVKQELINEISNSLLSKLGVRGNNNSSRVTQDSIHVFLSTTSSQDASYIAPSVPRPEFKRITQWSNEAYAAFSRDGVHLKTSTGEFGVKKAGLYIIYSHISFDAPDFTTDSAPIVWFGQKIRMNQRTRPILIDQISMVCAGDAGLPCYNSNLFSVIYLGRDSVLTIEVTPISLLASGEDQRSSYFGLIRIPE